MKGRRAFIALAIPGAVYLVATSIVPYSFPPRGTEWLEILLAAGLLATLGWLITTHRLDKDKFILLPAHAGHTGSSVKPTVEVLDDKYRARSEELERLCEALAPSRPHLSRVRSDVAGLYRHVLHAWSEGDRERLGRLVPGVAPSWVASLDGLAQRGISERRTLCGEPFVVLVHAVIDDRSDGTDRMVVAIAARIVTEAFDRGRGQSGRHDAVMIDYWTLDYVAPRWRLVATETDGTRFYEQEFFEYLEDEEPTS